MKRIETASNDWMVPSFSSWVLLEIHLVDMNLAEWPRHLCIHVVVVSHQYMQHSDASLRKAIKPDLQWIDMWVEVQDTRAEGNSRDLNSESTNFAETHGQNQQTCSTRVILRNTSQAPLILI